MLWGRPGSMYAMDFLRAPRFRSLIAGRVTAAMTLAVLFGGPSSVAQPKPAEPAYSVPVSVGDFELLPTPARRPLLPPPPTVSEKEKAEAQLVYDENDAPSLRARRLIDFFATTLARTLEQKGFHASRTYQDGSGSGAMIRGVFAEPDALNQIRRSVLGGGSRNARFYLYVGIFNQERPEQPLYQPAAEQRPINGYGPIITLNNYVPMAKYELNKNPTEEDVQKICNQIAESLVVLLEKNPHAFTH